ncbi:hypothetical protein [Streptomyces sp. MC1]|uniref:hypothetical protein n=1 Tax=Streptomyces sp. MC1 TaxID=295105 RepID=UPI0027DD67E1|nr:hypothetical protein [Streptomyces sp. MC1]
MIFRDGRAVDAVQRADGGGSREFRRGARLGGLVGAADDQRQSVGVRVVVTVAHQPGHIEQLLAQQPEDTYGRATVGNTYVLARQTSPAATADLRHQVVKAAHRRRSRDMCDT